MHIAFKKSLLAGSVALALASQAVWATNGLAPTGVGIPQKGMGGASAGNPMNTMSMATNPASAAFIEDGYDVGLEVFSPDRSAKLNATKFGAPADPVFDGNGKSNFLIPEGGYKKKINDKVDAGIVVYGNGGMNTQYNTNPGFGTGKAGVDYQQLFISPTASYKINENNAVGISANIVYHKFKSEGLQNFDNPLFSASPGKVTNNGYDSSTGIGATVGWEGKVNDNLTVGASYRSKVSMGKLDKYKGLFPNQGEFDVPAAATLGMSYKVSPQTMVAADVERIFYKDVDALGNKPSTPKPFGSSGGPGFGWDNQTVYKIGVKQQATPKTAVMAGFNYGKNPIGTDETTINVLAPGVVEKHLSLGLEHKITEKSKITATYVHAFDKTVKGKTTVPPPGPVPMDAYDLKMQQDAIGVSYSVEF